MSTRNAPTLAAFEILSMAEYARSMKGSLIGFISIPYAIVRAVLPTVLSSDDG